MQRRARSKSGTVQKRRTAKPEVVFVPIWYLIHSFSEQVSILRYQILWKEDVLIWHLCMPLRDSIRRKLSNQFYKSCRTQIRYDTFINERGPATTIEPENWNDQIQKFPKFIVVYDRQLWLEPENSLKLIKAKYFHSSLSFTIDTAIIHLTFCVSLWSHDCK